MNAPHVCQLDLTESDQVKQLFCGLNEQVDHTFELVNPTSRTFTPGSELATLSRDTGQRRSRSGRQHAAE
jgi:hypothetical protein